MHIALIVGAFRCCVICHQPDEPSAGPVEQVPVGTDVSVRVRSNTEAQIKKQSSVHCAGYCLQDSVSIYTTQSGVGK